MQSRFEMPGLYTASVRSLNIHEYQGSASACSGSGSAIFPGLVWLGLLIDLIDTSMVITFISWDITP